MVSFNPFLLLWRHFIPKELESQRENLPNPPANNDHSFLVGAYSAQLYAKPKCIYLVKFPQQAWEGIIIPILQMRNGDSESRRDLLKPHS